MIISKSFNTSTKKVSYRFLVNSTSIFPTAKPEFSVLVLGEDSKVVIDNVEYQLKDIMPDMETINYTPKAVSESERTKQVFKELNQIKATKSVKKVLNK